MKQMKQIFRYVCTYLMNDVFYIVEEKRGGWPMADPSSFFIQPFIQSFIHSFILSSEYLLPNENVQDTVIYLIPICICCTPFVDYFIHERKTPIHEWSNHSWTRYFVRSIFSLVPWTKISPIAYFIHEWRKILHEKFPHSWSSLIDLFYFQKWDNSMK